MSKCEENRLLTHVDLTGFLSQICNEEPYITLKTQCGTGKYSFQNISYRNDELILEFKLVQDINYIDTENISHNLGSMCFLTTSQFLCAYNYQAFA